MADRDVLPAVYAAFNARDVDAVLAALAPGVRWANGWEGGFVHGHDEVRDYWRRQWAEIDPHVDPLSIDEHPDGSVAVRVHAVIRDRDGKQIADNEVVHVYRFEDGLVTEMTIEESPEA